MATNVQNATARQGWPQHLDSDRFLELTPIVMGTTLLLVRREWSLDAKLELGMRFLSCLLMAGFLSTSTVAQPAVPPRPQPTPSVLQSIQEVHEWSKDKATISLTSDQIVYETAKREMDVTINQNGTPVVVKQTVNVVVPVVKTVVTHYALNTLKATDVDGKALTADEVFKRLPSGSAVLVFHEGYKMPASHKRLFSKDAVILVPSVPDPMK